MSYLDRRDLLSADLMTRSISKEGSIKYYNSDKNVANIYMKLMAESPDGAQKEVSVDEASNYTVTIDAIKSKTNQIRTVPGVLSNDLTDETCAIWKFELGEDLTNQIGEVICQTYVKNTTQNLTMRYFAYTVEADKLTGLNSEIVTDPDLPILKELIKEVQETAQTVNNIDNVNVSDTKTYSNKKIEEKFSGVDAQFNTIAKKTIVENGKLYLLQEDGTKIDTGTTLPIGSGSSNASDITLTDVSNNFTSLDVEGALNELFQSASNGKTLIANAITGKGVTTSNTDTFSAMATNIGKISGGSSVVASSNTLNKCGSKKITFGIFSDIHIVTDTSNSANVKFANALTFFKNQGCNFVVNCGDIANYDLDNELNTYKTMITGYTLPIYEVAGNHDCGTSGYIGDTDSLWSNATGKNPRYEIINNEDVFLFLSQRKWKDYSVAENNRMLTQADRDWLTQKLESYKSKKRVFLFHHQYLDNCEGFAYRNGTESNTYILQDLSFWTNIASTYKNVIWFSGHSHSTYDLQASYPNNIVYNKNGEYCAMVHVPSLQSGQYYIVNVYDNLIEIEGYQDETIVDTAYYTVDNYTYIEDVESVVLSSETLSFVSTDTQTLTATVTPANQSSNLTWETSDANIATVINGVVTPVGNGSCTITARCGSKSDTCNVTVNISVSELYYSVTNNLNGCTSSNTATSIKENEIYVATITEGANLTISSVSVTMGGIDITSTAYNSTNKTIGIDMVTGNIVITVNVIKQVTGINITDTSVTLNSTGATHQLNATKTPTDGAGTIVWSSDNESIATVNASGLVTITATTSGSCIITASCNGYSDTCTINVSILSKTVIYSKDIITGTISAKGNTFNVESTNYTLQSAMQQGIKYYVKATSMKDSNGNDLHPATDLIYLQITGGLNSSGTSVAAKVIKDYADFVSNNVLLTKLDSETQIANESDTITTFTNFRIKASSSSTATFPMTVNIVDFEIFTYGETI